jgi:hypothetical protein
VGRFPSTSVTLDVAGSKRTVRAQDPVAWFTPPKRWTWLPSHALAMRKRPEGRRATTLAESDCGS